MGLCKQLGHPCPRFESRLCHLLRVTSANCSLDHVQTSSVTPSIFFMYLLPESRSADTYMFRDSLLSLISSLRVLPPFWGAGG